MTDDNDASTPQHQRGDIANGHILTGTGWLPLRRLPTESSGPYYAGDVLNGHAFTGSAWVPIVEAMKAGGPVRAASRARPTPTRSMRGRWLAGLAVGLVLLAGLGVLLGSLGGSAHNAASVARPPSPTGTPSGGLLAVVGAKPKLKPDPAARFAARMKKLGWMQVADNLWGKEAPGSATEFSVSWKVRVLSPTGCPNGVYLEANVLNSSKVVVGYTNNYLPSLPANQQAILELTAAATAVDGTLYLSTNKATCN